MSLPAPRPPREPFIDGTARFTRQTVGHRSVVAVSGEVDVHAAPSFRRAIDEALSTGGAELWIDLSETDFLDSSGLHALVDADARVVELKRRLTVICPPGPVRRVIDVSGLGEQLPLAVDRTAAHRSS